MRLQYRYAEFRRKPARETQQLSVAGEQSRSTDVASQLHELLIVWIAAAR